METKIDPRNLNAIQDATGYGSGDVFRSEKEVRDYFTPAVQMAMFGVEEAITDVELLNEMAETVIRERSHCEF